MASSGRDETKLKQANMTKYEQAQALKKQAKELEEQAREEAIKNQPKLMNITNKSNPVAVALYAILGGKFLLELEDVNAQPGHRFARVLNENGEQIGQAYDWIYKGEGWSVHTVPFAGYVSEEQICFVHNVDKTVL